VILIVVDFIIAQATGSLAVQAELVHNMVDFVTAVAVVIGLKLSSRKTKDFPYGLYKLENVIAVFLGVMTFVTAYEIARDALFASETAVRVSTGSLIGVLVAAAIPLTFSVFEMRVAEAANSPALTADAKEYRAHVFTTGVVFAALLGRWIDLPLDRIAALVIVVAIVKTGWDLLAGGMRVLLDASLDAETLLEIRRVILDDPLISDLEWVTGRNAGRYRFVEAEVTVRSRDLEKTETAVARIEDAIKAQVPFVERVLIHAEPMTRDVLTYAVPLETLEGAISPHFEEAPYYALAQINVRQQTVVDLQVVSTPTFDVERGRGIKVAEWLISRKIDGVIVAESLQGKGPVYALRDATVDMRETQAETLDAALEILRAEL
jgi:cation diffusion facilitator family transporter